jgi:hypothetical protein
VNSDSVTNDALMGFWSLLEAAREIWNLICNSKGLFDLTQQIAQTNTFD